MGPGGASTTKPALGPLPFADRGDPNAEPGVGPIVNVSGGRSAHAWTWLAVLFAVLVVLLLAVPALVRFLVRRRRLARHDPASVWREVVDSLMDCGIPVAASESPRGLARRLTGSAARGEPATTGALLAAEAAGAFWSLAAREEQRRYALNGDRGDLDAASQVREVRAVRHGLRGTLSRVGRLRATLAPLSVWGRLRTRVPALVADALDTGDRMIAAVVGRLPRLAGRG